MFGINKTVVFTAKMLDAGYLMLDIPEFLASDYQKLPVSGIQYPGSRDIAKDFQYNG
jgi:hypothetical protein